MPATAVVATGAEPVPNEPFAFWSRASHASPRSTASCTFPAAGGSAWSETDRAKSTFILCLYGTTAENV